MPRPFTTAGNPSAFASVFDWTTGQYNVYEHDNPQPLMADSRRCVPTARGVLGFDINQALCPLPPGTRYVGKSPVAVGQVVRHPRGMVGVASQRQQPGWAPGLGGLGAVPLRDALWGAVIVNVVGSIITTLVLRKFVKTEEAIGL